ncbi:hypothetical protein BDV93DRAFT_335377 [Ceratobasidium sp. AG-I]|nr:hypothetical protein BDV93DRAFT_335377 [Ceratobasidium sp. AG-I]
MIPRRFFGPFTQGDGMVVSLAQCLFTAWLKFSCSLPCTLTLSMLRSYDTLVSFHELSTRLASVNCLFLKSYSGRVYVMFQFLALPISFFSAWALP